MQQDQPQLSYLSKSQSKSNISTTDTTKNPDLFIKTLFN